MLWAANGRWIDGAVVSLVLAAGFLVQTGLLSRPASSGEDRAVAVLFAPWVDSGSAMQRAGAAGGRIVRFGALPFIVVVEPESPDFTARVTERGAVLILDPRALAACFTLRRA